MPAFRTTHWSVVLATRAQDAPARAAIARLCLDYRAPVVAFIRHSGWRERDAEDLAQAFFVKFLEARWHDDADPALGRFRNFLLMALKRFLANEYDHAMALKRGGAFRVEPLDTGIVEKLEDPEGADAPERAFDRAYARAVIARAMTALEHESQRAGKLALFAALKPFLLESPEADDYQVLADTFGLRRNTLAVLVKRLRERLNALVSAEIATLVAQPSDVPGELESIRHALLP